jgi:hypothetical protein
LGEEDKGRFELYGANCFLAFYFAALFKAKAYTEQGETHHNLSHEVL